MRGLQEPDTVTRSAVWEDFDGDGDLDVAFGNLFYSNRIYRNDGDGTFTDVSAAWGIDQTLVEDTYGVIVGDYDNDGDGDLFFTNGGFNSLGVNRLYRNDFNVFGRFTETAATAGVHGDPANNHAAAWVDFNLDGWLDLIVHRRKAPSSFYRNLGDGTFLDELAERGINLNNGANGACTADFDNDGDPDILLPFFSASPTSQGLLLLENRPEGQTMVNRTQVSGLTGPSRAFSCAVDDFNQDGWLDLYVSTFNTARDPVKVAAVLYLNSGKGIFTASTAIPAVADNVMGLQSGDLDNNGFPDLFIGRGEPDVASPDLLLMNQTVHGGPLTFVDATSAALPTVADTLTHGTNFVDINRDGRMDIFVGMGGNMPSGCPQPPCAIQGQEEPNRFFIQDGEPSGSWLRYRLVGMLSNRDAIGARVMFVTDAGEFHRHTSGGNGFNTMNPLEVLAGLGTATKVDRVWVKWPSGIVQEVAMPALGQMHVWVETGIRADPLITEGTIEVRVVGPSAVAYEIWGSDTLQVELEPPKLLATGNLDADLPGRDPGSANLATVTIPIPSALRDGRPLYFKARVQLPGGWYITNTTTVEF